MEQNGHVIKYVQHRLHALMQQPSEACAHDLVPTIHIKARCKDGTYEQYAFPRAIPHAMADMFATAITHVWDWYLIYNTCEVAPEAFTQEQTVALENIRHVKRNRIHEKAYITLHEEQIVICGKTGISYCVRLSAPSALQLETLHPVAIYSNVANVMQTYIKRGMRLESQLEPQVLAGMLLTILKHKDLLVMKDAKKANLFLQQATVETLSFAVRYFYNLPSVLGKPRLSLMLEDTQHVLDSMWKVPLTEKQKHQQEAELFILNYVRACKGETVEERHIQRIVKPLHAKDTLKVKIYTDTVKQERKQVQAAKVDAKALLNRLPVLTLEDSLTVSWVNSQLSMLQFLNDDARKNTATRILSTWSMFDSAQELADVFTQTTSKTLEDDLLSFSHTVDKEAGKIIGKVDFASLLGNAHAKIDAKDGE